MRGRLLRRLLVLLCFVLVNAASPFAGEALANPQRGTMDAAVTVRLEPARATLWLDGKPYTAAPHGGRLKLRPGRYRLEARLAGYGSTWRVVKLQAGENNEVIELRLVKRQGRLSVVTSSREAEIFVDGRSLGFGRLDGPIAAGLHRIGVVDERGERALSVVVLPGAHVVVRQEVAGNLVNEASVGGGLSSSHVYRPPWVDRPSYGIYVMGHFGLQATLNGETRGVRADDRVQGGPLGGLRVGYRFLRHLGAEGLLQYGNQSGSGLRADASRETYDLSHIRFGAGIRFWLPERSVVGLLAGFAAGAMWNRFSVQPVDLAMGKRDGDGWGGFAQADIGLAFRFRSMFASLSVLATMQTTSGLGSSEQPGPFGDKALVAIGPSLGLGYGFW